MSNQELSAERQARVDLAAAYRLANNNGFNEGIDNHFTCKIPGRPEHMYLIPYGLHWREVTASNLIEVDHDGNTVGGEGWAETTAHLIHAAVHRAQPDTGCVMHCHMPYPLALTMIEDGRLVMGDQNACRFYGRVAYDDHYGGSVLDTDEADRIADAMGDKNILFMANHGITVSGPTVAKAWEELYYLNQACTAQVLAMSTGRPLRVIPDDKAAETARQIEMETSGALANVDRHFEALKRLLDRDQPDYKN